MENIMLIVLLLVVVEATHHAKHHPKFPRVDDFDTPQLKRVSCANENHNLLRHAYVEKSMCGEPKDVFIHLKPTTTHEKVSPGAVWVKRCVGLCDHEGVDSKCVATKTKSREVPVRIYNAETNKDTCAIYYVEEDVSCGCCALSPEECAAPRVHNPRKCTCQCPNLEERRECRKKLNSRWNRSKCLCEEKRRKRQKD